MTPRNTTSLVAALIAGLALSASADTVTLKNGRELHGRLVEETAETIVLRTGAGGQIVVLKEQIATFTENANWGDDQGGRGTGSGRTDSDEDGSDEGGDADTGEGGSDTGGPTPDGDGAAADWKWPSGLSAAEIAKLTEIRDDMLAELEELGPSAEERMEAIDVSKLSASDKQTIDDLANRMGYNRQNRTSAVMVRRGAKDRLVSEFGLKAIPSLIEAVDNNSYWQSRMGAVALGELVAGGGGEDAKWYCYHLDVPKKLIDLMGHQGEFGLSPSMRLDANAAMEQVTGHSVGFVASKETLRTAGETKALRDWRKWWSKAKADWKKEEEAKAERREAIAEGLDALKAGRVPEGYGEDDPLGD